MGLICAWCGKTLRPGRPLSHGICDDCFATVKASLHAASESPPASQAVPAPAA